MSSEKLGAEQGRGESDEELDICKKSAEAGDLTTFEILLGIVLLPLCIVTVGIEFYRAEIVPLIRGGKR